MDQTKATEQRDNLHQLITKFFANQSIKLSVDDEGSMRTVILAGYIYCSIDPEGDARWHVDRLVECPGNLEEPPSADIQECHVVDGAFEAFKAATTLYYQDLIEGFLGAEGERRYEAAEAEAWATAASAYKDRHE